MSKKTSSCMMRAIKIAALLLLLAIAGVFLLIKIQSQPRPEGTPGPEADTLAREMMEAINHQAWEATGAIAWNFGGRQEHLWDRNRHFARVRWGDIEALVDLTKKTGVVKKNGAVLSNEDAAPLIEKAWAFWANDSFWLNPISKVFDPGTMRSLVKGEDGSIQLLITYSSGGVTPGDAYLWTLGAQNLPTQYEMWVSIIPIGGFRASWEDWTTLSTGVKVSQKHDLGLFTLKLTDIKAANDLSELESGPDPFAALIGQ